MSVEVLAQNQGTELVQAQIIRILRSFPYITKSMLSAHVGTYGPKYGIDWLQVYNAMVTTGVIIRSTKYVEDRVVSVLSINEDKVAQLI